LDPAGEENEDRTIFLFGNFGSIRNPIAEIKIVGELITEESEIGTKNNCPEDTFQIVQTTWDGGVNEFFRFELNWRFL